MPHSNRFVHRLLALTALTFALSAPLAPATANRATPEPSASATSTVSPATVGQRRVKVDFRERALRVAAAQAGDPYVYGATGPRAFDCSGLTSFAFAAVGHKIPRTAAAQYGATKRIRARDARRGDLVFFHGSSGVYHVGIYAGHHRIWHSPYTGSSVHKERIWTSAISYGRVR